MDRMRIFWGSGKIGTAALTFFREMNIEIDFFCDSNLDKIGSRIMGIQIISPRELVVYREKADVYITCAKYEQILSELEQMQFDKTQIHLCNSLNDWVLYTICKKEKIGEYKENKIDTKILFELSNGLALGGIEAWCIKEADRFNKRGYPVGILVEKDKNTVMKVDKNILVTYPSLKDFSDYQRLTYIKEKIMSRNVSTFISNSPCDNFIAACMAKQDNNTFQIVSVIHNDEIEYFKTYMQYEKYIDKLLVISKKIKNEMVERGFPQAKIIDLPWQMSVKKRMYHQYNLYGLLHIGYAGRITKWQKRLDLLLDVIPIVIKRDINCVFEIAGDGDYFNELQQRIDDMGLRNSVIIRGFIPREQIPEFWSRQDIMVSFSDYEGHSITQCEAMAAGAVPIVTDVSGARDDVEDGINGYIVDVGTVDQIVDRICYLDEHRELLPVMGRRAYETIKEKYSEEKVEALWSKILDK